MCGVEHLWIGMDAGWVGKLHRWDSGLFDGMEKGISDSTLLSSALYMITKGLLACCTVKVSIH